MPVKKMSIKIPKKIRLEKSLYCNPGWIYSVTIVTDFKSQYFLNSVIDFVNQFKSKSTTISWKYGIKGSLWQKRFYDHILRKDEDIQKIGEYILNNPVRRRLVGDYREYPYGGYIDKFVV